MWTANRGFRPRTSPLVTWSAFPNSYTGSTRANIEVPFLLVYVRDKGDPRYTYNSASLLNHESPKEPQIRSGTCIKRHLDHFWSSHSKQSAMPPPGTLKTNWKTLKIFHIPILTNCQCKSQILRFLKVFPDWNIALYFLRRGIQILTQVHRDRPSKLASTEPTLQQYICMLQSVRLQLSLHIWL